MTKQENTRFITKAESCADNLLKILLERDVLKSEISEIMDKDLSADINIEILKTFGIPILESSDKIALKTRRNIKEETFCFVDIETNMSATKQIDIIEIGAIKWKDGEILGEFESLVRNQHISKSIVNLTGIHSEETRNAPRLKTVLGRFKAFLGDCVFVAHSVNFDFNTINEQLINCGLPIMKNRKLCSHKLAQKTIEAPKHGLEFLNEFLEINYPIRHRALADSIIALQVFEKSLLELEKIAFGANIHSTEDIINFLES